MREIRQTTKFRRDYRRELSGVLGPKLEELLRVVLEALVEDQPLPRRYADHALVGEWGDCRDCHIRPDLVLIYRKPDDATIELVRLGSHGALGL